MAELQAFTPVITPVITPVTMTFRDEKPGNISHLLTFPPGSASAPQLASCGALASFKLLDNITKIGLAV